VAVKAHDGSDAYGNAFVITSKGTDAHVLSLSFLIGSYSISRDVFFPQLVFEFKTYILNNVVRVFVVVCGQRMHCV
jgi:hypothetical protein